MKCNRTPLVQVPDDWQVPPLGRGVQARIAGGRGRAEERLAARLDQELDELELPGQSCSVEAREALVDHRGEEQGLAARLGRGEQEALEDRLAPVLNRAVEAGASVCASLEEDRLAAHLDQIVHNRKVPLIARSVQAG